jgi:hemerythrin-like domain-containing protein
MNAIELLEQQHRQVEELFSQIESSHDVDEMADIFAELADAFLVHSHIEEEIFYPAVFAERTEEELRQAVEEHLQVKRIIADMLDVDPSDEQWTAKCTVLLEDIQHHVEEEEGELFPLVQRQFGEKRLRELGAQMQERAEELKSEGEPRQLVYEELDEPVLPA